MSVIRPKLTTIIIESDGKKITESLMLRNEDGKAVLGMAQLRALLEKHELAADAKISIA